MARKVNLAALAADDGAEKSKRAEASKPDSGSIDLPIDKVALNPLNQRLEADEDSDELEQLTETIRQHGVLQPLVVCTVAVFLERYPEQSTELEGARWVTLIGNRRLVAARGAELQQVPALVNDERAGSMFEVMLVENSHRRDLAPLREAEAIRQLLDREQVSQAGIARRIGRTPAYVTQRLALLSLIPTLKVALDDGSLSVKLAREYGTLSAEEQEAIAAAGPPDWTPRVNRVNASQRRAGSRRGKLPVGDPEAAARSIRELYSGDELTELIRLLVAEGEQVRRSAETA